MNLATVFRNDYALLEAKLNALRLRQIIKCCPACMRAAESAESCAICRPRSAFPSAFSSQAEWDNEQEGIDIPLLASKITLIEKPTRPSLPA
jgi:hypothetical protein